MGISPMYKGATGPDWTPTITFDSGANATLVGVSANSFVLTIKDTLGTFSDRTGGGTTTIADAPNGKIIYSWGANDTAFVSKFTLQFSWVNAQGKTQYADPFPWEVRAV